MFLLTYIIIVIFLLVDVYFWTKSDLFNMNRFGNWPGSGYLTYYATLKGKNNMACEICGRSSCTRSFHSFSEQDEFDTKTGTLQKKMYQWKLRKNLKQ